MSTARMGIQELKELPFTPVHAPIMAVAPGMQRFNFIKILSKKVTVKY